MTSLGTSGLRVWGEDFVILPHIHTQPPRAVDMKGLALMAWLWNSQQTFGKCQDSPRKLLKPLVAPTSLWGPVPGKPRNIKNERHVRGGGSPRDFFVEGQPNNSTPTLSQN